EHAALFRMNQEFACVKTERKLEPGAHPSLRHGPARTFRHVLAQRFVQRMQARGIYFAHFGKMLGEKSAAYEFGKRRLCKLVCVKVRRLLYETQTFDGRWRRNNPSYTQPGECNFRKTVDVNDDVRPVELFERRNALVPIVQARVNVILDNRHLIA